MEQEKIMGMIDKAPIVKADGLSGDYRALGEFNSIVLAGHQHSYRNFLLSFNLSL